MYFIEGKKEYIKCNILARLKQNSLLLVICAANLISGIILAIANNPVGSILFFVLFAVLLIGALRFVFKTVKASQEAWRNAFGTEDVFNSQAEIIDNETIVVKRSSLGIERQKKISDIALVERFKNTIVIVFSDNTSFTLKTDNSIKQDCTLLDCKAINQKLANNQKSFSKRLSIQAGSMSLLAAFICCFASTSYAFGERVITECSYFAYPFIVIPCVALVFDVLYKNKSGVLITLVAIFFLSVLGSFSLVFKSQINDDPSLLNNLEQRLHYELPEADSLVTKNTGYYTESSGKFNEENAAIFENSIKENGNWIDKSDLAKDYTVNQEVDNALSKYNYILIYNEIGQYYYGAQDRIYWKNCILMAYRVDTHSFTIMYDFTI